MEHKENLKLYYGQFAPLRYYSVEEVGRVMLALMKYYLDQPIDDMNLSVKEKIAFEFMLFESESDF